jgi:hypothetical protein
MFTRRQFLQASAVGSLATLTGCSAIPAPRPMMDFSVNNARDTTVQLTVRFFRPNVIERSEALVYRKSAEIPPRDNPDDLWTLEDAVRDRRYRIEVDAGANPQAAHYHYHPDCSDNDPYEIGVVANLRPNREIAFTQTTCSSNEPFL